MNTNILTLSIPFQPFYLWRTQRLTIPVLLSNFTCQQYGERITEITECPTHRSNRIEMRRPSTGRQVKEDVGYHYRVTEGSARYEGHNFLPSMTGAWSGQVHEWRLSVAGQHSDTIFWQEKCTGVKVYIPKHIVFTNRGWQTVDTFRRNPHLKLYRPLGHNNKSILESNFREINRECMVYDRNFGWYDTVNYAKVEVDGRTELHDITETFEYRGNTYPLSAGAYRITDVQGMRKFVRGLVDRVMEGQMNIETAVLAFKHGLHRDGFAEIIMARGTTPIDAEIMWRGLYMKNFAKLVVEKVRILKEFANSVKIIGSSGFAVGSCNHCGNTIYSWQEHETAIIDLRQVNIDNGDADEDDDECEEIYRFCNEEHALQHSLVARSVGIPQKHGYHTDVLHHIPMGRSTRKAAHGDLRRCGIELETYHCESSSAELTKYIVGGSLPKKMKNKKQKKAIVWNNRTYEQFGAIPTRDGSLDGTYGVEWVFRPSDLGGMFQDVSQFMAMTQGYIEHDADSCDSNNRTYGLHIHVTATDTMKSQPTRVRVALVASRLDRIFHKLGHRGYTNYTRKLDCRFLVNHQTLIEKRNNMKRYVERSGRPSWMAYVKPMFMGDSGDRMRLLQDSMSHGQVRPQGLTNSGEDLISGAYNSNLFVRYNMTNISLGRPTIEFRHGRSFVDANHIMLNVELSQAVAMFASYEMLSVAQASYDSTPYLFRDYVFKNRKEYPRLAEWFLQNIDADLVTPRNNRVLARIGG